jgi:hypothetical protein
MALNSFDVSLCEEPQFLACHDGREDPADWSMVDVSPAPEYVGAIAMRAKQATVKTFRFADC